MSDFVSKEVFECRSSSPYDQLFRDIYFCTSPSELKKIEPIIKRNYLLQVQEDDGEDEFDQNVKKSASGEARLGVDAQYRLDRSPRRLQWLDSLTRFMEERGTPITVCPTLPDSQSNLLPLDLYLLFNLTTIEAGGLKVCTEREGWGRIARRMKLSPDKSHILRKIYKKFLLPFEEHQRGRTSRGPGHKNSTFSLTSVGSSSSGKRVVSEAGGEKDRQKVRDLRTHLNNNSHCGSGQSRVSVFSRLGPGPQRKKGRS